MMRHRLKTWAKRFVIAATLLGISLSLAIVVTWQLAPFPFAKLDAWPASPHVTDETGRTLLKLVGSDEQWRQPIPLSEISPWVIKATLAVEDARFREHFGVDARSILRATVQNLVAGEVVSGASTISMQVCRMVDDRPRTFATKWVDASRALQLERHRTKDEILETYLNIAPYGGNLRGVEAAAMAYFGKHAGDLSLGEASLLAGLPQSPTYLRPDRAPRKARSRRAFVLIRLRDLGWITPRQAIIAHNEPIVLTPPPESHLAPHAAWLALQRRPAGGRTTVRMELQQEVERKVARHASRLPPQTDIAAVVLELETGDITALVGSADSSDPVDGQVNGVLATRSPGSALKPFLYAAAMESGRLCAESTVYDGPIERAGWSPENFDRTFAGEITAADALRRSLNVPAILITEGVGLSRCLGVLEAAGISLPVNAHSRGGLALAIGGIEVNLLDLTNAYATLGRKGVRRTPRLFVDETSSSCRVLDQNVCANLNEILSSHLRRPAGTESLPAAEVPWFMWKTGTSSGRRDAWAVGHNGRYAIGVWVGRFSGAGHQDYLGATAAEPLLAELFSLAGVIQRELPLPPKTIAVTRPLRFPNGGEMHARKLRILSPAEGDVFSGLDGDVTITPNVQGPPPQQWFLNGRLVSPTAGNRFKLTPGNYELRCIAEEATQVAAVRFRVE